MYVKRKVSYRFVEEQYLISNFNKEVSKKHTKSFIEHLVWPHISIFPFIIILPRLCLEEGGCKPGGRWPT